MLQRGAGNDVYIWPEMVTFSEKPKQFPLAFLWMLLSAGLFVSSWTAIGQFWPLIFLAFVPLIHLRRLALDGSLTTTSFLWFTAGAFFLWNAGTIYFLFFIDDVLGIRLLSALTPIVLNTIWMTAVMYGALWLSRRFSFGLGSLFFVLCWLALEWMQHHWTLAFPWLTLGNVMGPHTNWIQWYSVTGVAGGSLWILCGNVLIERSMSFGSSNLSKKILQWSLTLLFIVAPLIWSTQIKLPKSSKLQPVDYTIVQPCLSNADEKFEIENQLERWQEMLALVRESTDNPTVVVLPETALFDPGRVSGAGSQLNFSGVWLHQPEGSELLQSLKQSVRDSSVNAVIAGAFASRFYQRGEPAPAYSHRIAELGAHVEHYNSVLLIDRDSIQFRHKTMLVAGVERVPFAEYIPLLNDLALDFGGVVGTLGKQDNPESAEIDGHNAGVQVCYDSVFGWVSAAQVRSGAEVLIVLTNDSWWGDTPGYRQLLSFARLRAVETGRPVVRAANNGISAVIAPDGTVTAQLPWNEIGALTASVSPRNHITFYSRFGDYIYTVATILLLLLIPGAYVWDSKRRWK